MGVQQTKIVLVHKREHPSFWKKTEHLGTIRGCSNCDPTLGSIGEIGIKDSLQCPERDHDGHCHHGGQALSLALALFLVEHHT